MDERESWEKMELLLHQRKKLMEGNQTEVAGIIRDLENRLEHVESLRRVETSNLQLLLDATNEKLRVSNRRLRAAESTLEEMQMETERRVLILQDELSSSRREFALLQDSMKALVTAHRKAVVASDDAESDRAAHRQKERDLELREVHLVDQLSDAKAVIYKISEELAQARDKSATLERSWLQAQRDLSALQSQLDDLRSSKRAAAEVQGLREVNRLLEDTVARLLHVVSRFGANTATDAAELSRAKELFRFVAATGPHQFVFLGDATIRGDPALRPEDHIILQDLKTVVHDYSRVRGTSKHADSVVAPLSTTGTVNHTRLDPFLRLQAEKDYWLPRAVIDVASRFHSRYFPDAPIDIVYTLVVSVATAMREFASNVVTPSEVALLDLERRERGNERARREEAAVRSVVRSMREPKQAAPSSSQAAIPDKCQSGAHHPRDGPLQGPSAESTRCMSALRSLISQVDKLCSSSHVFKTLPASQVREILASTLRTVERLSRSGGVGGSMSFTAHGEDQPGFVPAATVHALVDVALPQILDLCARVQDAAESAVRDLREAMKMPQHIDDPELAHGRDCCASKRHVVLTKAYRTFLVDHVKAQRAKISNLAVDLRDAVLNMRRGLLDGRSVVA